MQRGSRGEHFFGTKSQKSCVMPILTEVHWFTNATVIWSRLENFYECEGLREAFRGLEDKCPPECQRHRGHQRRRGCHFVAEHGMVNQRTIEDCAQREWLANNRGSRWWRRVWYQAALYECCMWTFLVCGRRGPIVIIPMSLRFSICKYNPNSKNSQSWGQRVRNRQLSYSIYGRESVSWLHELM